MKTKFLAGAVLAVLLSFPQVGRADLVTYEIDALILPSGDLNNNGQIYLEFWDQNEIDPLSPKILRFQGYATTFFPIGTTLNVYFDWKTLDPQSSSGYSDPVYSDPFQIPLAPTPAGSANPIWTPIDILLEIPFCPPEVSIHFGIPNDGANVSVAISGVFSHECLNNVPDVLSGFEWMGVLGLLAGYRRITNRAACNA